jgi:NAD+ kinase
VKAFVLGNAQRPGVVEEVKRRLPLLREHFDVLVVDLVQEQDLSPLPTADVAFVFGGDGAILRAARQMAYHQAPVLGVNLGRLGFLADIHPQDLDRTVHQIVRGEYRLTRHLMYECLVERPGQPASQPSLGLNEVAVHSLPPYHMLELDLEVDGEVVARFGGDGLILSTPIGSTAHNLSAGGPILTQGLSAFAITPISPHTLTYRPIVESADQEYRIRMGSRSCSAMVILDGQETITVNAADAIVFRKAPVCFQLVKVSGQSYYQTLRDKLRWGTPLTYRGEP